MGVHVRVEARGAGLTRVWSLQERCVAALARVERTDFLSPMCIGEVAHVSAEITYTSKHSVEVQVHVMSENILTGNGRMLPESAWWGTVVMTTVTRQEPSHVHRGLTLLERLVLMLSTNDLPVLLSSSFCRRKWSTDW